MPLGHRSRQYVRGERAHSRLICLLLQGDHGKKQVTTLHVKQRRAATTIGGAGRHSNSASWRLEKVMKDGPPDDVDGNNMAIATA